MKTSHFVLSALFASCEAVKINDKFVDPELLSEENQVPIEVNNLQTSTNVRQTIQNSLRSYLNAAGPPLDPNPQGQAHWTSNDAHFNTIPARNIELRFPVTREFGHVINDDHFPNWILPGSEAIMPKKSADLDLLDDEMDPKTGNFRYLANYDPAREMYLQMPETENIQTETSVESGANARSRVRAELQSSLRAYLNREGATAIPGPKPKYPYDRFPATVLPGSEPVMPVASAPIDLFDGSMTDGWTKNHRSTYNGRDHAYNTWGYLQLDQMVQDEEITVEEARVQAAQMQAQMDKAVADADAKRADQQTQYESNINNNDPAAQLQGLMNAQQSLHRLTSAFSAKPNMDKVNGMAEKLGIPMTPELMQLGSNEAISNALVEIAVGMGKSEGEIEKALD